MEVEEAYIFISTRKGKECVQTILSKIVNDVYVFPSVNLSFTRDCCTIPEFPFPYKDLYLFKHKLIIL